MTPAALLMTLTTATVALVPLPATSACSASDKTEGFDAAAGRVLTAVAHPGPCRQWTRLSADIHR